MDRRRTYSVMASTTMPIDMLLTTSEFPLNMPSVYHDYTERDLPDDDELYTCSYCNTTQKLEDAMSMEHRFRPGCVSCGAPVILIDRS